MGEQAWNLSLKAEEEEDQSWKDMIEKDCRKVGVNFEDAHDRIKCTKSWKKSQ